MTQSPQPAPMSPEPGALSLEPTAAAQFAYHVRMTAVFAVAGQAQESASEAILAWAILVSRCPDANAGAAETGAELIDQRVASLSDRARSAAVTRAHGLALDIEAHYVTVGRQQEATLYAEVADQLSETVDALLP